MQRWKLVLLVVAVLAVAALLASGRVQCLVLAYLYETDLADSTPTDTTETDVTATTDPGGRPATLLSAFFGLDNALPWIGRWGICAGAGGMDGMPVIFSHELEVESLQATSATATTITRCASIPSTRPCRCAFPPACSPTPATIRTPRRARPCSAACGLRRVDCYARQHYAVSHNEVPRS